MCERMCKKFGIEINYYEIKEPEKIDVKIWMHNGDVEPRYEFYYRRQRYGSHPLEKSAPERDGQ